LKLSNTGSSHSMLRSVGLQIFTLIRLFCFFDNRCSAVTMTPVVNLRRGVEESDASCTGHLKRMSQVTSYGPHTVGLPEKCTTSYFLLIITQD